MITDNQDKWISIEERLPEDKTKVIVKRKADGKEKNATYYSEENFLFSKAGFAVRLSSDKNYSRRRKRVSVRYDSDIVDAAAASKWYTLKEITHWKYNPNKNHNSNLDDGKQNSK